MIYITVGAVFLAISAWISTYKIANKYWKSGIHYGVKHYDALKDYHKEKE